jgi:hypothetical protein
MARDFNAILGLPDEAPSAPVVTSPKLNQPPSVPLPQSLLTEIKNTSQFTPEQKAVAGFLGNPNASRDVESILNPSTTLDNTNPPSATNAPWYETGNMPPQDNSYVTNAMSVLSKQQPTEFNPYAKQIGNINDALNNQLVQQKAYELAHQGRSSELQAKHDALEEQHNRNVEEHNRALNEHIFAKSLTPEIMYRQHMKDQTPSIETSQPEVNVGKSPLGGPATKNYATEYGATQEEAAKAPSMSKVQKENIPRQTSAFDVMTKEFPNMPLSRYENYPFILAGESGEQYLKEKMTPEHENELAQEKAKSEEEKIKQNIEEKLIEHKARAMFEHEIAKAKKEESATLLKEAKKELESHHKFNPSDVKEKIKQISQQKEIEKKIEVLKNQSKLNLRNVGLDEYGNTYPIGNGAGDYNYAQQLLNLASDPKTKPDDRNYFIEELNKLERRNPIVFNDIQFGKR